MIDLSFVHAGLLTLLFSSVTATHYYFRFFKKNITIALVLYSLLVFCIVYFVSFENNLGLGIGLLGILSLVRLRSTPENPIDIGHIFYSITIGLLNASISEISTIIMVDGFLTVLIILLSSGLLFKWNSVKTEIVFDDLEAQKLNDYATLMKKVEKQFGITPRRIKITNVNYLRDTITIEVTYHATNS